MILKIIKFLFSLFFGFISLVSIFVFIGYVFLPFSKTSKVNFSITALLISLAVAAISFFLSYLLLKDLRVYYAKKVPIATHELGYNFAGFHRRVFVGILDFIVYVPIIILPYLFHYSSEYSYVLMYALTSLFYYLYILAFMSFRGQTIGKMIVKIKVLKTDGTNIGFINAIYRSSVDITLTLIGIIGYFIMTPKIHLVKSNMTYTELARLFYNNSFNQVLNVLLLVWLSSEFITLLFNTKRRAVHDFIAGTIVLDLSKKA